MRLFKALHIVRGYRDRLRKRMDDPAFIPAVWDIRNVNAFTRVVDALDFRFEDLSPDAEAGRANLWHLTEDDALAREELLRLINLEDLATKLAQDFHKDLARDKFCPLNYRVFVNHVAQLIRKPSLISKYSVDPPAQPK